MGSTCARSRQASRTYPARNEWFVNSVWWYFSDSRSLLAHKSGVTGLVLVLAGCPVPLQPQDREEPCGLPPLGTPARCFGQASFQPWEAPMSREEGSKARSGPTPPPFCCFLLWCHVVPAAHTAPAGAFSSIVQCPVVSANIMSSLTLRPKSGNGFNGEVSGCFSVMCFPPEPSPLLYN